MQFYILFWALLLIAATHFLLYFSLADFMVATSMQNVFIKHLPFQLGSFFCEILCRIVSDFAGNEPSGRSKKKTTTTITTKKQKNNNKQTKKTKNKNNKNNNNKNSNAFFAFLCSNYQKKKIFLFFFGKKFLKH